MQKNYLLSSPYQKPEVSVPIIKIQMNSPNLNPTSLLSPRSLTDIVKTIQKIGDSFQKKIFASKKIPLFL